MDGCTKIATVYRHTCTYCTLPHNEHFAVVDGPILILEVEWLRLTASLRRSAHLRDLSVVLNVELQMIGKVLEVAHLMGGEGEGRE